MGIASAGRAPSRPAPTVRCTCDADITNAFIFLSCSFQPKSDSRRSHFWTILFCTGRRSDAASAARRARRLPDDAAANRTSAARIRAQGFPFSGNATQRIATWTVNR
ncbi:hypothetical protein WQ49_12620 [Burkholderia cenocepacia]|nr:hypothetical protein WQ49_12620 [Burkholderia cenocepacia]